MPHDNQVRRAAIFAGILFALLFALPFPFGDIPFTTKLAEWWHALWMLVVPWIADHVLRLGFDVRKFRGGGEPTREYVRVGSAAVLAIVGGTAWALLDGRRTNAGTLNEWLRLYVRLYLIGELLAYGLGKVIPNQFSALGPDRLSQTFGESSPDGLLWAFMGYSVPYIVFAGLGETIAGILLCFRRTVTLGALIGIAVTANVVMLNFAYDVGVKLHSTFYLLGLVYLAAPDLQRLLNVLVFNRATEPEIRPPLFETPWKHRLAMGASGLLCAFLFVENLRHEWGYYQTDGRGAAKPALYGLYDVETIRQNGATHSTAPADSTTWSRLAIGESRSSIRMASGILGFYTASVDTMARTVRLASRDNPALVFSLSYARPDTGHLTLRGTIGPDSIEMQLARRDELAYPLMKGPYKWAQDWPSHR